MILHPHNTNLSTYPSFIHSAFLTHHFSLRHPLKNPSKSQISKYTTQVFCSKLGREKILNQYWETALSWHTDYCENFPTNIKWPPNRISSPYATQKTALLFSLTVFNISSFPPPLFHEQTNKVLSPVFSCSLTPSNIQRIGLPHLGLPSPAFQMSLQPHPRTWGSICIFQALSQGLDARETLSEGWQR